MCNNSLLYKIAEISGVTLLNIDCNIAVLCTLSPVDVVLLQILSVLCTLLNYKPQIIH